MNEQHQAMPDACPIPAGSLLAQLDDELETVVPLAVGATCKVWRLNGIRRSYALRVMGGRKPNCSIPIEVDLRASLTANGAAIPRPLADSSQLPKLAPGFAWMLDAFAPGEHPPRGQLGEQACRNLGQTLAALHKLPATNFRPVVRLDQGTFAGRESAPVKGLSARFSDPLPPDRTTLASNPAVQADPELCDQLWPLVARLREEAEHSKPAVCHTDLHERQFLVHQRRLSALLDLGDAIIADPRWDFGSLFYFHGHKVLAETLHGYTDDNHEMKNLAADAQLFSVGIALHHASRSRLPGKGHRLPVAISHIRRILADPMVTGRVAS